MNRGNYKWTNKEITKWADKYLVKKATLYTVESKIGISHSTLWWCFQHRLDKRTSTYKAVMKKLATNRGGKRT